jgi:hypothetical protein
MAPENNYCRAAIWVRRDSPGRGKVNSLGTKVGHSPNLETAFLAYFMSEALRAFADMSAH